MQIWGPVLCLLVLHFIIQRQMLIFIWKSQAVSNPMIRQNADSKFYTKFYFFNLLLLVLINKIINDDGFLIVFFGFQWVP